MDLITISQLKQHQKGRIRGHVVGSASKTIIYDETDRIEIIVFGEVALAPKFLYEINVEQFVFKECVPIKSAKELRVVSDLSRPINNGVLKTYFSPVSTKRRRITRMVVQELVVFVSEKCNRIKNNGFYLNSLTVSSSGHVTEMCLYNIKSEWFLYLIPGNFYCFRFKCHAIDYESNFLDLIKIRDETSFSLVNPGEPGIHGEKVTQILSHLSDKHFKKKFTFTEVSSIADPNFSISIEAEVVSIDSFDVTGFVSFADADNMIQRIALTPARRTLPKYFIPGSKVSLSHLLVKKAANSDRKFLYVTEMTQIALSALPMALSQEIKLSTSLQNIRVTRKTGISCLILSIDSIISVSVDTMHHIICKLSVTDYTDSATLHIRDNIVFLREVFGMRAEDEDVLRGVRLVDYGRIEAGDSGSVTKIFAKVLAVSF